MITVRDSGYLTWRFFSCPTHKYSAYLLKKGCEILGFIVLRISRERGLKIGCIVDIVADPDRIENFVFMLLSGIKIFRETGVDVVSAVASHKSLQRALYDTGFFVDSLVDFAVYTRDPRIDKSLKDNPHGWFITMGDGDYNMEDR